MIKNKNLSVVLLILLSTTLGCRMMMKQMQVDFFKGDAAQKAANAVKDKVVGSFKVQEVEITEGSFTMKIETPGNPQNIDEYTSLGYVVAGPKPVQLNGNTRTLDRLPFDEIDFSVVPQIIQNALDKTRIEGGAVTKITFMTYVGNKFGWDVDIQGTRETASARADLKGNIVSVNLSQTNLAANYKILGEAELTKAAEAIKAKFGENAQFGEISINEDSVSLKIINAENPKMFDTYTFGVSGLKKSALPPLPASMAGKPFAFSSVNLPDAVNLVQRAKEKLAMTDGQVTLITIKNETVYSEKLVNNKIGENVYFTWTVSIKKGTNSGFVKYDDKFNEISVKKD